MKQIRIAVVLSLAVFIQSIHAADIVPVESAISEVTVYSDRAQVTRTAEIDVVPGENRIVFDHLPAFLADDSVRASGKGKATVTIEDIAVRTAVHEQPRDTRADELEKQVQEIHDQLDILDARQRVINEQRSLIQRIEIKSAGDVSHDIQLNKFDVSQLKDLPSFVGAQLTQLEDEAHKLLIERRDLDHKAFISETEFNKYRNGSSRTEKSVLVTLNASESAKLRLHVSYVLG